MQSDIRIPIRYSLDVLLSIGTETINIIAFIIIPFLHDTKLQQD